MAESSQATQPLMELMADSAQPQQIDLAEQVSSLLPHEERQIEEETVDHRPSTQEKDVSPQPILPQKLSVTNSSQLLERVNGFESTAIMEY